MKYDLESKLMLVLNVVILLSLYFIVGMADASERKKVDAIKLSAVSFDICLDAGIAAGQAWSFKAKGHPLPPLVFEDPIVGEYLVKAAKIGYRAKSYEAAVKGAYDSCTLDESHKAVSK